MLFDPADWPDEAGTVTVYRSPAAAGGTVAAKALAGTVVGILMPAQLFSASGLGPAPEGVGGARYDQAFTYQGTAIRVGDDLRRVAGGGTTTYRVQKVNAWSGQAVAFVDEAY
jgi:hypothetical protein